MIFLTIAYIVASLLAIPTAIRYAIYTRHEKTSAYVYLSLLGTIISYVALGIYMASIGHGIVALIVAIPAIVGALTGIVLGVHWAVQDERKKPRSIVR